jgi:ATP-binding cassette subfamily F protein 3
MLERLERVDAVTEDRSGGNFNLRKIERAGNNVLTVEDLSIGYDDNLLADSLNFTLHRGEALGIIGGNGTGKTTLLKTFLGQLPPLSGAVTWGTKTYIGYYSQNLEDLDPRNEILGELRRVAPLVESGELRSYLSRFLFFGDDVFKRVGELSGGEKGRLALAKLIYSAVNVLILDEPTNHLDIPSREALESALEEYEGTIITVSHDRFFLDKIATEILSFEPEDRTEFYYGNYTQFHEWKQQRKDRPIMSAGEVSPQERTFLSSQNPGDSLSKNQRLRLEERIKQIEGEIPVLEELLEQLGMEMSLPHVAGDLKLLDDANARYSSTEQSIQELYAEWEKISNELEAG